MRHSKRSREERRLDAVDRDFSRRRRTDQEQLDLLDQRPGNSTREREKILLPLKQEADKQAAKDKARRKELAKKKVV